MKKLILLFVVAVFTINVSNAQNVININSSNKRANKAEISNNYKEAKRIRAMYFNKQVQTDKHVKVNDIIQLDLFNDKEYEATIDKISTDVNGTFSIRAKLTGSKFAYCFITTSDGNSYIDIEIPENNEFYKSVRNPKTNEYFLMEIDKTKDDHIKCGGSIVPPVTKPKDNDFIKKNIKNNDTEKSNGVFLNNPYNSNKAGGNTIINVLVVYTQAAKKWADGSAMNMNNIISSFMEKGNLVLENSKTSLEVRLVHSVQVNYTELNNSQDLYNLKDKTDGYMDNVHALRDEYAADLVVLLEEISFTGGLGYLYNDKSWAPAIYGFSLTRIQQASGGITVIHEIGHNMGCGHSKYQKTAPGPGVFSYSSGHRWEYAANKYYCTVMTYGSMSEFPDGNFSSRTLYFSDPNIQHEGKATGDATEADNARTIRETKEKISQFRSTVTISKNISEAGTISGGGVYEGGDYCRLKAVPKTGYKFVKWTENGKGKSTKAEYNFFVKGDLTLVAVFENLITFDISASTDPANGGTINGVGALGEGTTANLTVTLVPEYGFVNWTEGGSEVTKDEKLSFTVTKDRTFVANLVKLQAFNILASVSPANSGTVTGAGTNYDGKKANLVAKAKLGYKFTHWTEGGKQVSTDANFTFTVTKSRSLVANFIVLEKFEISASVNPANYGTISGAKIYYEEETASLVAKPNTGYKFTKWTEGGNKVSASANFSFKVSKKRTLVANFTLETYKISANVNQANSGTVGGAKTYNYGETATLKAVPETGFNFINWTEKGNEVSRDVKYTFTVDKDRALVANFSSTTGIADLNKVDNYTLYPNPTNKLLNIKLNSFSSKDNQNVSLSLIDLMGKKFDLEIINKKTDLMQVDVSNINQGIYFLQIMKNNEIVKTLKVVISK